MYYNVSTESTPVAADSSTVMCRNLPSPGAQASSTIHVTDSVCYKTPDDTAAILKSKEPHDRLTHFVCSIPMSRRGVSSTLTVRCVALRNPPDGKIKQGIKKQGQHGPLAVDTYHEQS